jgi:hypothetical protein
MSRNVLTTGYWFYQLRGDDELSALSRSVRPVEQAMLSSTSELNDQDVVFLWLGGTEPGLRGWGTVLAVQVVSPSANPAAVPTITSISAGTPARAGTAPQFVTTSRPPSLSLSVNLVLPTTIPRAELASYSGLSDAPLIRQIQTGTYFRLSAEQAYGLRDFLLSRNFPAPEIAVGQVLEPIARRVERELAELPKLLPLAGVAPNLVQKLTELGSSATESLRTGGALGAYDKTKTLVDLLASAVGPETSPKTSAFAPLDAARTRLTNDLSQLARFAGIGAEVQIPAQTIPAALEPEAALVPATAPPPAPSGQSPAPAASAAAPVPSATAIVPPAPAPIPPPGPSAPSTPVPEPNDPLFKHWEQSDLIGISAAVNNLARFIAHEGLVPPVAVGVFGDWGSGKTFFIRALQSQIALFADQSRAALRDNRTTVFCSHTVQIEFNAWHFVESNLWASLAAHIFDRLYAELDRRSKAEGTSLNIDGLYQQFSVYKQAVADKERLDKLVEALAKQRDEACKKKQDAEQAISTRLSALAAVLRDRLSTFATEQLSRQDRSRLDDLLHVSNLEQLRAAQGEVAAVVKQGQTWVGQLRVQLSWWGGWQYGIFVVLILGAVFGVPTFVHWLLGAQADILERVATFVGAYAVVATSALGWLARAGRQVIAGARKIEGVLAEVRSKVESTSDPELQSAQSELAAAQSAVTLVDRQISDQQNRLAQLADALDPNQLGNRLQSFLAERVKNDAYQRHLGMISLVRKDFSSLYDLMQKYWQDRKQPVPVILAEVRDAVGKVTSEQVPFIERIVLYIDDLDRCPEDKVVEVLQAVQLMLGLPLFVVVVAVDVRWVGQSIRKHYGRLVGWDEETGAATNGSSSASAEDYLEKIFQIPFRIHPMEPEMRKLLLSGLLRQPYLSGGSASAPTQTSTVFQQELVPKELSLYPEELQSIQDLYQTVGSSPRRVRRFLDVYRLMRAGMEEGDVQDLILKQHYAVILALFALLSGAPLIAPRIIELLRKETLRTNSDPAGVTFATQSMVDWSSSALSPDAVTADESEVLRYAMTYLDGMHFNRSDLVSILRRWIPEIARYSFREVRMQRI